VGAAGTAMRFLIAYFAGQAGDYVLTGTTRMKNRPVHLLVEALRAAGAKIEYLEKEGFPPLHIMGQTLKGGEISLDGSVSSQYISALLMMAPVMTNGLRLHLVGEIVSTPYINLTIQLMRQFGVIVFIDGSTLVILPQQYDLEKNFTVESDWSAASYWYEMVALSDDQMSSVVLNGLWLDSLQGDASIAELFDRLGVNTSFTPSGVTLSKKSRNIDSPLVHDFTSIPDLAQTVVVTCAMLHIPFRFTGLQSLKIKETDRLLALKTELKKLGFLLEIQNYNTLIWSGEKCDAEPSPVVATFEDHRMAMAFAPASLCLREGICIADLQVVSKSYPSFRDDLKKANFTITEI
ncbi:MAG: 3-phosphoshikimate 1-carboxyvinyltransferase, partial [Prolixibacteraceae bacterium]|nr:3-phosphoshikimate 1-carboxyvinyltransferase [Prolixibacteraceae bacterium]